MRSTVLILKFERARESLPFACGCLGVAVTSLAADRIINKIKRSRTRYHLVYQVCDKALATSVRAVSKRKHDALYQIGY